VAGLLAIGTAAVPASALMRSDRGDGAASGESGTSAHGNARLLAVPTDGLTRAFQTGSLSEAQYALERARSLFDLAGVQARYAGTHRVDPHLATLVLRDLAVRVSDLRGAERRSALAILARPTDGPASDDDGYTVPAQSTCSTNFCFFWVTSTADAPDLTDADANGTADWLETTTDVAEQVWTTEVDDYGYRAPESDLTSTNHGPDGRLDIYLANLGDDGLFGYCTTDDPDILNGNVPPYDGSAYCVIDNDFSAAEFGSSSGELGLQVTLAHEFFHAVQFAYDLFEDTWFMESTATWMEDEVFDDVNDNYHYLSASSLRNGFVPVDDGDRKEFALYGNWVFIRFLSEYFGSNGTPDPTIVRDAWELADGAQGGPDDYSIQAIADAIEARNTELRFVFADFGAVNVDPSSFYEEGDAYPTPKTTKTFKMKASKPDTDWWYVEPLHLTNSYLVYTPSTGIGSKDKLLLSLDGPKYVTGPEGTAVVLYANGKVKDFFFQLSSKGDDSVRVPFGKGVVDRVVLVITNASTRYTCWKNTVYSCAGKPTDDGLRYSFRAQVV
jgi:hypothetical protein